MSARSEKRPKAFDRHGNCPICGRVFRDTDCPHSVEDAVAHIEQKWFDDRIRLIVRQELAKVRGEAP